MKFTTLIGALAAVLGLALMPSCVTTANQIEATFDCNAVCSRYQDCFDEDYDVDACVDRCTEETRNNEAQQAQVNSCEVCIDDRSCAGSFGCVGECGGIVP